MWTARKIVAESPSKSFARRNRDHFGDGLRRPGQGGLSSEIDLARRRGWAIVDGELEPGIRSIAAPLRNAQGQTVAAMNIATDPSRATVEQLQHDYLPHLVNAVAAAELDIRTARAPGA